MSKMWAALLAVLLVVAAAGCAKDPSTIAAGGVETDPPVSVDTAYAESAAPSSSPEGAVAESTAPNAAGEIIPIGIEIGDETFSALLYDTETTQAWMGQMPMTIEMTELNGNEKYYDLPEDLPHAETEKPDTIYAGDIMLWSSNTLVLFYDTFPNSYGGYVRLGSVEDSSALAQALGTANVTVTFRPE